MASIARTSGNIFSGVDINTDLGSLVSIAGAQPLAFGILLKVAAGTATDIDAEGEADETIDIVLRKIQEQASIIYYQVETTSPFQISVLCERASWTAGTLQTAIRALGTTVGTNSKDVSTSTVTNVGMKLALS